MYKKIKKKNKYERSLEHAAKIKEALAGSGLFVFKNNNAKGELFLPKPAADGRRSIPQGGEFQGDSYFMELVKNHEARLIRTIKPVDAVPIVESEKMETKLIVDQPDRVTTIGKVEAVLAPNAKKINENKKVKAKDGKKSKTQVEDQNENSDNPDVLLTGDDAMDGIEIIL